MAVNPAAGFAPGLVSAGMAGTLSDTRQGIGIIDAQGLQRLRAAAHENSPEALKQTATQFEALFLDMVMKSMRDATPSEGLMDSEQSRTMQGMLDQQYAKALATRGVGLADVLVRQLSPKGGLPAATATAEHSASSPAVSGSTPTIPAMSSDRPAAAAQRGNAVTSGPAHPGSPSAASAAESTGKPSVKRGFIDKLLAHAESVSAATGIPSRFMIAHAALESGWGRREIRNPDGSASHNIFGIKAGANWKGKVTEVATTEYVNGVPHKRTERFRSYDSYAAAFADYARTLTGSARYRDVLASASDATGFAYGLQKAGYATDPQYAHKLSRVIARV